MSNKDKITGTDIQDLYSYGINNLSVRTLTDDDKIGYLLIAYKDNRTYVVTSNTLGDCAIEMLHKLTGASSTILGE